MTTTYPSVFDVTCLGLDELKALQHTLAPPQTDVERTVHKRIARRVHELAPPQPTAHEAKRTGKFDFSKAFTDLFGGDKA